MRRQLILTFHGLGEPLASVGASERAVWVPVQWFEAIVEALPPHGVVLAFDDGNASDVREALPALTRHGIKARFFPLAGRLGETGYLSADDVVRLSTAGMDIGSHGLHHRDWRQLGDRKLREELGESRRTLSAVTGTEVTAAACPFGSYDRRVLRALRAAGYRRVFTSDGGTHRVDSWLSSRTTVDQSRPLHDWLNLARAGASTRNSPAQIGKRILKRVR